MKTFKDFIVEITQQDIDKAAPGMSPEKRRAAYEKNARRQARRDTPANKPKPQSSLPPGKTGGAIEKPKPKISTLANTPKPKSGGLVAPQKPKSGALVAPKKPQSSGNKTYSAQERAAKNRGRYNSGAESAKQKALDKMKADGAAKKKAEDNKKRREQVWGGVKKAGDFAKDALKSNQENDKTGEASTGASIQGAQRRTKGLI